ncbi:MAG: FGGY family carbohydrate kinase, partial [Candidatus Coproplasma sp.]
MKRFLAIDIGASSGRHIVGWLEDNRINTEEVYRFPNGVKTENNHLVWDTEELFKNVKQGIKVALNKYPEIVSLAIDTWGVDYVLLNCDKPILPCYAYRDGRTEKAIEEVHKIIPFEKLYSRTGIQFEPFNTIYQLYCDKMQGRLNNATDYLM